MALAVIASTAIPATASASSSPPISGRSAAIDVSTDSANVLLAGLGSAECVETVGATPFVPGAATRECVSVAPDSSAPSPTPSPSPTLPSPSQNPDSGLFFAKSVARTDKLVFAHWFPPFPVSLDNAASRSDTYYARNYLNPAGEKGKWSEYGRFLTTAPLYRSPRTGNWQLEDAKADIRTAQAFGLDGFVFDLLGSSSESDGNWSRALTLAQAADELNTGFKVVPMVDKNGSTGLGSAADAAKALARFANRPSSYYRDGKFVVSSFKGEGKGTADDVQWWRDTLSLLKKNHSVDAAWIAGFLNFSKADMFKDLTIGEGSWGGGDDPVIIQRSGNQVAASHARGKIAMSPVGTSAVRRTQKVYDESANTEATRAYWEKAIRENPEIIQMVTWNDYSEGNTYQPSEATGYGPLLVASWYIQKYKYGSFPTILRDELILTHRNQFSTTKWTGPQSIPVQQWDRGGERSEKRDTVEALTFLTAPATVTVVIGGNRVSYEAPAGMYARTFPLAVGTVSASTSRGLAVTSPVTVTSSPEQQDMGYYWAVAGQGTTGQGDPTSRK